MCVVQRGPSVTVQLYDTTHVSRITAPTRFSTFREVVQRVFRSYLVEADGTTPMHFTLHYYPIEDDPTTRVKFAVDDEGESATQWKEYLETFSEAAIVCFAFKAAAVDAKERSPLRDRMPNGLRVSVAPLRPSFTASTANSAKERISPTQSRKAKERDGGRCVMCNQLPV